MGFAVAGLVAHVQGSHTLVPQHSRLKGILRPIIVLKRAWVRQNGESCFMNAVNQ